MEIQCECGNDWNVYPESPWYCICPQCEKRHYIARCSICREVMVRTHYQNEEGDWFVCWLCGCEPDPLVYKGDHVMENEHANSNQCITGVLPGLRERSNSIIQVIAELETLLEKMIGPAPDCECVPTRGEGSLFILESDLNLIFDRLHRVRNRVGEVSEMV